MVAGKVIGENMRPDTMKLSNSFKQTTPYCGLPILVAALFLVRFRQIEPIILLWSMMIIVFGYITSVLDIKTKKIPNKLVLAMLLAWAITIVPVLYLETSTAVLLIKDSALGFALGGGLFLLVYVISRKGLGGGDVKFMAAAGLYLGLHGVVPTIFCGSILAAVVGCILLLSKKITRKDTMPLAPFLYAGMLINIFFV